VTLYLCALAFHPRFSGLDLRGQLKASLWGAHEVDMVDAEDVGRSRSLYATQDTASESAGQGPAHLGL
jgi:hypothetical protein